jgi:hypothetical protein
MVGGGDIGVVGSRTVGMIELSGNIGVADGVKLGMGNSGVSGLGTCEMELWISELILIEGIEIVGMENVLGEPRLFKRSCT